MLPSDVCILTVMLDASDLEMDDYVSKLGVKFPWKIRHRRDWERKPELHISSPQFGHLLPVHQALRLASRLPQDRILSVRFIRQVTEKEARSRYTTLRYKGQPRLISRSLRYGFDSIEEGAMIHVGYGMPFPQRKTRLCPVVEVRASCFDTIGRLIRDWHKGSFLQP